MEIFLAVEIPYWENNESPVLSNSFKQNWERALEKHRSENNRLPGEEWKNECIVLDHLISPRLLWFCEALQLP